MDDPPNPPVFPCQHCWRPVTNIELLLKDLPGGRNFSCTFVLQNCDMAHGNLIGWQRRSMFATSQLCQVVICMWQYVFSSLSGCASKPKGFTEHKDLLCFCFQMMHGGYPMGITERHPKKWGPFQTQNASTEGKKFTGKHALQLHQIVFGVALHEHVKHLEKFLAVSWRAPYWNLL